MRFQKNIWRSQISQKLLILLNRLVNNRQIGQYNNYLGKQLLFLSAFLNLRAQLAATIVLPIPVGSVTVWMLASFCGWIALRTSRRTSVRLTFNGLSVFGKGDYQHEKGYLYRFGNL